MISMLIEIRHSFQILTAFAKNAVILHMYSK